MNSPKVRHLIDVDHLSLSEIENIFYLADSYEAKDQSQVFPNHKLINLFFENSTRTRSSFEIAAKNLAMQVINIDVSTSSVKKGESEIDTILTLNAMKPNFITIRHSQSGSVGLLAKYSKASIINSGDGAAAHPTQALLDCYSIMKIKNLTKLSDFKQLKIAICGDIINSRVARSNIKLLTMLGAKINLVGPVTLMPKHLSLPNLSVHFDLKNGLAEADIVMALRIQSERMQAAFIPSLSEFFKLYGLTKETLNYAKKDAILLHPGPINREIEISSELASNEEKFLALEQVKNGVIIRQAILEFLA